jgi:hypothetical protein
MTTKIEGQLEIDHERGVIYFHENATGITRLRICQLPRPVPSTDQLDVTAIGALCSWKGATTFRTGAYLNPNMQVLSPDKIAPFLPKPGERFAEVDYPVMLQLTEDPGVQVMGSETHRSQSEPEGPR